MNNPHKALKISNSSKNKYLAETTDLSHIIDKLSHNVV
jgi:hypothetical protein